MKESWILLANDDVTLLLVVESKDKFDDGRSVCIGLTKYRRRLVGLEDLREVFEHLFTSRVPETNIVEFNFIGWNGLLTSVDVVKDGFALSYLENGAGCSLAVANLVDMRDDSHEVEWAEYYAE